MSRETKFRAWLKDQKQMIEVKSIDFDEKEISYIEVKGINDYKARKKVAAFPYPIKVFTSKDMKKYLDYMVLAYGSNWRNKF